jgi:transposase
MGRPLVIAWQEDTETLFRYYSTEKLPDIKVRLQALWLLHKGHNLGETADIVGVHYVSLQQWVAWYRAGGIAEVRSHRKAGKGALCWLSPGQQEQFRTEIAEGRFHTAYDAWRWVEESFGIKYQVSSIYSLLARMGAKKRVPRPLAVKASLQTQEEWKKGDSPSP